MKTMNVFPSEFTPVAASDITGIAGGSFAYDVGRAIRFLCLSAGGPAGQAEAIAECIALHYLSQ